MTLEAIKSKNQGKVNRAVNWLVKHNDFNDQRDVAEGDGNLKLYDKVDAKCQTTYDKFEDAMWHLPKYEQTKIYKSKLY